MTTCYSCHVAGGIAAATSLRLDADDDAASLDSLQAFADNNSVAKLLDKTLGQPVHGGGNIFGSAQSQPYQDLAELFGKLDTCEQQQPAPPGNEPPVTEPPVSAVFAKVALDSNEQTLRKAALTLNGRVPTDAEIQQASTEAGLKQVLRGLMQGERFEQFIMDGANRWFITRGALPNPRRVADDYPNMIALSKSDNADDNATFQLVQQHLKREPLELVRYIVSNDLSYKNILTADYTMVTRELAQAYNVDLVKPFGNGDAWTPARIKAVSARNTTLSNTTYPHAGVLTTQSWLSRFPTTDTNRNRHRVKNFMNQFLGIDLETLGQRPVDDSANAQYHVPTMEDPNCLACHATMDPIAGAFANWGVDAKYWQESGSMDSLDDEYKSSEYYKQLNGKPWYEAGDIWYRDVLTPGFEGSVLPGSYRQFGEYLEPLEIVDRSAWTVFSTSTSNRLSGNNQTPEHALDGNNNTYWLSKISSGDALPHHFAVDMHDIKTLNGLRYYPRKGDNEHIGRYKVRVSTDGSNWTEVASGQFDSDDDSYKDIRFDDAEARYFEIINQQPFGNGETSTAIAEIFALSPGLNLDQGLANHNGGNNRLQWLALETVEDPRFARGTSRFWYQAVFGQQALSAPQDTSAANYAQQLRAFEAQDALLESAAQAFVDADFNLKALLVALIDSELYRASSISEALTPQESNQLADIGFGHLATPAELNAKSLALTASPIFDESEDGFGLTFGGFDGGKQQLDAITEITPTVLGALEISTNSQICQNDKIVVRDIAKSPQNRLLLPKVDISTTPGGDGTAAIKANIQYLFSHLLAKELPLNDPEIEAAYGLFVDIYNNDIPFEGNVAPRCESGQGISAAIKPQLRAWQAVLAYLLNDFEFISK